MSKKFFAEFCHINQLYWSFQQIYFTSSLHSGTNAKTFPHINPCGLYCSPRNSEPKLPTLTMTAWVMTFTVREWEREPSLFFFTIPHCSSFDSHYKGCVRYWLAACNVVHFASTAGGWGPMWNANRVTFCVLAQAYGNCSGLIGYHSMSSAYTQWSANVPSTTTTVPQEV